jgi:hypothetical protein
VFASVFSACGRWSELDAPNPSPLPTQKTKHSKQSTHNAAQKTTTDGFGFSQMSQANGLKISIIGGIHAVHYFRGARALLSCVRCVLLFWVCVLVCCAAPPFDADTSHTFESKTHSLYQKQHS